MFFIVNYQFEVIFGWSAKSGCSHVKKIAHYLGNGKIDNKIHTFRDMEILPDDISMFTSILIIRNPFERLVSGFFDKYNYSGEFNYMWKSEKKLTFKNFVGELENFNWDVIQKYHFSPQTSGHFDLNKINKCRKILFFDIEKIDYSFLENLFKRKIPNNLLTFRGGHENKKKVLLERFVYNSEFYEYNMFKVQAKYYYNQEIKKKVTRIYRNDFEVFGNYGFDYII